MMATPLTPTATQQYILRPVRARPRESVRTRIMAAVRARLERIARANGFETNIGTTVYEGMLIDAEPPVIPSCNFWDGNETGQLEAGMILRTLQLTVEAYDQHEDDETPDRLTVLARHMVIDVERALWIDPTTGRPEPTLGGLAVGIEPSQSQPVIGLKPQLWIGSTSLFDVLYRTKAGDPYTHSDIEED
jgi:hypothetical protein